MLHHTLSEMKGEFTHWSRCSEFGRYADVGFAARGNLYIPDNISPQPFARKESTPGGSVAGPSGIVKQPSTQSPIGDHVTNSWVNLFSMVNISANRLFAFPVPVRKRMSMMIFQ